MKHLALVIAALAACSTTPKDPIAELEDPSTCMQCHPQHYDQWSGSMHAYASDDPVFVAMNNRGQREAQLGTFCAQCHVPMAVANGRTDFTNFDPSTLAPTERGVTCYFCHDVKAVAADHNNGLELALDQTMRGGAANPVASPAHDSLDDPNMASATNKSAMCGSCHDVVTPAGVALERTYTEWQTTVFAENDPAAELPVTCSGCHMISSTGVIAQGSGLDVGTREYGFHDHSFPAIDQALIASFPNQTVQAMEIQETLEGAIAVVGPTPVNGTAPPGGICVDPDNGGEIRVRLDTFQIGHDYPSGAGQDRRAWIEMHAYGSDGTELTNSGVVGSDQDPEDINDPLVSCTNPGTESCSGFWDRAVGSDGAPAHFFWQVASETSHLLKPAVTLDPTSPNYDHSTTASYVVGAQLPDIDHITAVLHTRPFSYAMLNDLVSSNDLAAPYAQSITTVDAVGTEKTWTKATADPVTGCSQYNQ